MQLLSDRPLVVWPNPFHQLDHKGRPACAVRLNPDVSAGERRYIGATRTAKFLRPFTETDHPGAAVAENHKGHYDVGLDFNLAPVEIPDTHYHRDRIRDGELVPGDKSTARRSWGGGINRKFEEPLEVLKREQAAACELWAQEHDEDPPAGDFEVVQKKAATEPEPKAAESAAPAAPADPSRLARGLAPKPAPKEPAAAPAQRQSPPLASKAAADPSPAPAGSKSEG